MKKLVLLSSAALLSACASPNLQQPARYQPETAARIRLFGQNGKPTIMTVGMDCAAGKKGEEVNVGGGMGDAFRSFTLSSDNHSIGMPASPATNDLKQLNGILSKAFYREYIIPAGKPVNVKAAYIGLTTRSGTPAAGGTVVYEGSCQSQSSFVPKAGADYEAVAYLSNNRCVLVVNEAKTESGQTVWQPTELRPPVDCRKK